MKWKHNYEYKRVKNSMVLQMAFSMLAFLLIITSGISEAWDQMELQVQQLSPKYIAIEKASKFVLFVLQLPIYLLAVTIIHVKSEKDSFEGLSKLDNLVKVSIFQVYKDKEIRLEQEQFFDKNAIRESKEYTCKFPKTEDDSSHYQANY